MARKKRNSSLSDEEDEDKDDDDDEDDEDEDGKGLDEEDIVDSIIGDERVKPVFKGARVLNFKRTIGVDHLDTTSRNVVSSPLEAVTELVANAWDANAKRVEITYNQGSLLRIADNGDGMAPDEVPNFYRLGDSVKLKAREKNKGGGRPLLGKFGMATLGIRTLGEKYCLRTTKGGFRTTTGERFGEKLSFGKEIDGTVVEVGDKEPSGTVIEITGLTLTEHTRFSERELLNHLAWSLSPEHFRVMSVVVNGTPVSSKPIENAVRFVVDQQGPNMGQIKGEIYLTRSPVADSGIYVKVHGRRVGDPKSVINLHELDDSTARRIVGFIEADNLEKYIRADRGGFHPSTAYEELQVALIGALAEVRRYSAQRIKVTKGELITKNWGGATGELKERGKTKGVPEFSKDYRIVLRDLKEELPGLVSDDKNTIVVNSNNPMLNPNRIKNRASLRQALQVIVADILAAKKTGMTNERFWGQRSQIYAALEARDREGLSGPRDIFSSACYGLAELSQETRFSIPDLRYMVDRGLLKAESLGERMEIRGADFLEVNPSIQGLTPLPSFIKTHYAHITTPGSKERVEEALEMMGESAEPFVVGISSGEGKVCYLIDTRTQKEVVLALGRIDFRNRKYNPKREIDRIANTYYDIPELADRLSLPKKEILGLIYFAQEVGRAVSSRKSAKSEPRYRYGEIVSILRKREQVGVLSQPDKK